MVYLADRLQFPWVSLKIVGIFYSSIEYVGGVGFLNKGLALKAVGFYLFSLLLFSQALKHRLP
jgi:hypothetical protein